MLIAATLLVVVAVTLAVFAAGSQLEERAAIRTTLRRLDGYELREQRDRELLQTVGDRALRPALRRLAEIGRARTPVGYMEEVRRKHVAAGLVAREDVDVFLVQKLLGFLLVPVGFVLVFVVLGLGGGLGLSLFALLALVGLIGPDAVLNRKVEERAEQIRLALPEVLDLLVISVEAGLGFEQALDRIVDAVPGPLTREFARMLGEIRAGSSRAEAMRALERRVDVAEVRSFILAMLQADTFGVSIGRVLRTQADEMRTRRRQLAEERAQKAPVKMLIPMVLCIFPALFVVVIGPAAISLVRNL